MSEEILVEFDDGGKLAAVLHLPAAGRPSCPMVIYCPGKNGERYEVHRLAVKYARTLARLGFGVFRFDYYGIGLSDGEYYEMTTSTKVSNVVAAVRYLESSVQSNRNAMALLGFSDGARVALLAAGETGISRLILWSPLFFEIGGNFPGRKRPRFFRHPQAADRLVMPWAGLWVSMEFYADLQRLQVEERLRRYNGESLLVYSDDDPLVLEEAEAMALDSCPLYRPEGLAKVVCVKDGGHLFASRELEDILMRTTTGWLSESFG